MFKSKLIKNAFINSVGGTSPQHHPMDWSNINEGFCGKVFFIVAYGRERCKGKSIWSNRKILYYTSCYGSKTCCKGCFMLILFHVLSLIWGQFYRSLDNDLTCSGNRCLEQQLGTTEEPIQPIGINSLLLNWFFILFFSLFWFRSLLFLVFGGRGRRKALHMDVIGSCESGPCVRVFCRTHGQ